MSSMRTQDERKCCDHIPLVGTAYSLSSSMVSTRREVCKLLECRTAFSPYQVPKRSAMRNYPTNVLLLRICLVFVWQGLAGKQLAFWFCYRATVFYLELGTLKQPEECNLLFLTLHVERINVGQVFCLWSWCVF